jgi:hypothetical protein
MPHPAEDAVKQAPKPKAKAKAPKTKQGRAAQPGQDEPATPNSTPAAYDTWHTGP